MKEMIEVIARALVNKPECVVVEEQETEKEIILTLTVDPEDMGKVIGKQGRIAKAIRSLLKAEAIREDKKVSLNIG